MNKFDVVADFSEYKKVFLDQNSKLNLISKNDELYLYEKHIYDSLSIKLFFDEYKFLPKTLLDIGTGGGFPSVPIAIEYPEIDVYAIDSIRKKIIAVSEMSEKLGLKNLTLINDRIENISDKKFDVIVSRAVAKADKLVQYAYPLLNDGGYIVMYKSKTSDDELNEAKNRIRSLHLSILKPIEYELPLSEPYVRKLIIFKK